MLHRRSESSLVFRLPFVTYVRFSSYCGERIGISGVPAPDKHLVRLEFRMCWHDCYKWNTPVIIYLFCANFFDIGSD